MLPLAQVLITSRSYIALCLVPPEAGRIMGYRMGGDIMMAWNFSMFAVITCAEKRRSRAKLGQEEGVRVEQQRGRRERLGFFNLCD